MHTDRRMHCKIQELLFKDISGSTFFTPIGTIGKLTLEEKILVIRLSYMMTDNLRVMDVKFWNYSRLHRSIIII